ncbi:MAG: type II secretion system F family protein [Candidatus Riflebacteria bacterium]
MKTRELISFCNILAIALKSGKTLPDSLLSLKQAKGGGEAVAWCHGLARKIADGKSLETAVKELSGFDPVLAKLMPLLGEDRLISLLEAYTRYLVVLETLNQRLNASLAYPFLLLILLNFNLFHLNFFFFPGVVEQINHAGQRPNLLLRMLNFADPAFWPFSMIIPALVIFCLYLVIRQYFLGINPGGTIWGYLSGMNKVAFKQNAARAQTVIGLYLEAGFSLEKAILSAAELMTYNDFGLVNAARTLEQGRSVEEAFAVSPVLCDIVFTDSSEAALISNFKRFAHGNYAESMIWLKNISVTFATLALIVAGFFVLSVTSGFFDTYYWLIWSY